MLSALPVINLANCCCAWVLFGGALASYLMQQDHPVPITAGDGAIVGLLAGVVGAVALEASGLSCDYGGVAVIGSSVTPSNRTISREYRSCSLRAISNPLVSSSWLAPPTNASKVWIIKFM